MALIEEGWRYDPPDAQTSQELAQIAETAKNLMEAGFDGFEKAFKKGYVEMQAELHSDPEVRERAAYIRRQTATDNPPQPE